MHISSRLAPILPGGFQEYGAGIKKLNQHQLNIRVYCLLQQKKQLISTELEVVMI